MMFNIPEEILLAVKKGSYELDQRYPGWRQAVELSELDMHDCDSCVLAHVAEWRGLGMVNGYYSMLDEMVEDNSAVQTEWAIEHGFMEDETIRSDDYESYDANWHLMEEAWAQVVKEA